MCLHVFCKKTATVSHFAGLYSRFTSQEVAYTGSHSRLITAYTRPPQAPLLPILVCRARALKCHGDGGGDAGCVAAPGRVAAASRERGGRPQQRPPTPAAAAAREAGGRGSPPPIVGRLRCRAGRSCRDGGGRVGSLVARLPRLDRFRCQGARGPGTHWLAAGSGRREAGLASCRLRSGRLLLQSCAGPAAQLAAGQRTPAGGRYGREDQRRLCVRCCTGSSAAVLVDPRRS